jgi:acetoin utilization deacetylase AcuC-like enzyme
MSEKLKNRVGIIRDERFLEHKTGHVHPEHPSRLKAIYRMLDKDFPDGLMKIRAGRNGRWLFGYEYKVEKQSRHHQG